MLNLNSIYKFSIPKIVEVEETTENEDGSKTIKKVNKEVPQDFFVKKASRLDLEEKDFYYNQEYHRYFKAGILPEVLLRKLYGNENGIFTEGEKQEYVDLYINLGTNLSKIRQLEEKKEGITEEEKDNIKNLYEENRKIQKEIGEYESAKQSVFENSAEALSHNKTIFWCILNLLYKEENGKFVRVFDGDTHDERAEAYDKINEILEQDNEDSKFYSQLIERASFLISLYYMNPLTKVSEFPELVSKYDTAVSIQDE